MLEERVACHTCKYIAEVNIIDGQATISCKRCKYKIIYDVDDINRERFLIDRDYALEVLEAQEV